MSEAMRRAKAVPEPLFDIVVDDVRVQVVPGQTIAAALVAADRQAWRTTRGAREERGLFCGIGVCYDCLLTVNGVTSVRACLTTAMPGDVISFERGTGYGDVAV